MSKSGPNTIQKISAAQPHRIKATTTVVRRPIMPPLRIVSFIALTMLNPPPEPHHCDSTRGRATPRPDCGSIPRCGRPTAWNPGLHEERQATSPARLSFGAEGVGIGNGAAIWGARSAPADLRAIAGGIASGTRVLAPRHFLTAASMRARYPRLGTLARDSVIATAPAPRAHLRS